METERRISGVASVSTRDGGKRPVQCEDPSVTERALALARAGDEDAFRELTDPYRHELQLHCYRIVGSTQDAEDPCPGTPPAAGRGDAVPELTDPSRHEVQLHCYRIVGSTQDAEDLVQETLLAAWRGLEQFGERASIRTWLYRIATNRSVEPLRATARRPQSLEPMTDLPEPSRVTEPVWFEPYPDVLLEGLADVAPGPEARYEAKEATALAFVAGLHPLPPNNRRALVPP